MYLNLVHLTRDYDNVEAEDNLISILNMRKIEARNSHCLFMHNFKRMQFSPKLKSKFNTVCFTEVPLNQIKLLTRYIPNREIKLKPYGVVFWKNELLKKGANSAIYINAMGTDLRNFLLNDFAQKFTRIRRFNVLKKIKKSF